MVGSAWAPWFVLALAGVRGGEVFVDARDPALVPGASRALVHGEAGLSVGAGALREDPFFLLSPHLALDLSAVAPVWLRIGAPVRLRLTDRAPDDPGVLRRRDYDEAGDYLAILETVAYRDDRAFGRHGRLRLDLWVGALERADLPSYMVVADLDNGLDLDRRRSGLSFFGAVEGRLGGQRAEAAWKILATDLAMGQAVGGALELAWAGAFVAFEGAADPTAPRALVRDERLDDRFRLVDDRSLVAAGERGAGALALSVGYRYTDDWRVRVGPRLDLVALPGLGRGLAGGVVSEFRLAKDRSVALAAEAFVTYGDRGFEPAYFGALYVAERWQMPFAAGARPDDLGNEAAPKWAFVRREDLSGVGARGRLRLAVGDVVDLFAGYGFRPGPLGGQFDLGLALDLASARLSARYVHRGRHGFELWDPAGTLARLRLSVPVIPWLDVGALAVLGATMRPDVGAQGTAGPTGFVGATGAVFAFVTGKVPW